MYTRVRHTLRRKRIKTRADIPILITAIQLTTLLQQIVRPIADLRKQPFIHSIKIFLVPNSKDVYFISGRLFRKKFCEHGFQTLCQKESEINLFFRNIYYKLQLHYIEGSYTSALWNHYDTNDYPRTNNQGYILKALI